MYVCDVPSFEQFAAFYILIGRAQERSVFDRNVGSVTPADVTAILYTYRTFYILIIITLYTYRTF